MLRRGLIIFLSALFTFSTVTFVWAAERQIKPGTAPAKKMITKTPKASFGQVCFVSGTVKMDPNDKTGGQRHYKGTIRFRPLVNMAVDSIDIMWGHMRCDCKECPSGGTNLGGLGNIPGPLHTFRKDETRTLIVDCAVSSSQPAPWGPIGYATIHGEVEHAPHFQTSTCTGRFSFIK